MDTLNTQSEIRKLESDRLNTSERQGRCEDDDGKEKYKLCQVVGVIAVQKS